MNPELPNDSREALEIQLTAFILGELPEAEAETLRQQVASDTELQKLYRKLQFAAELVNEVSASGPGQTTQTSAPELRLDPARREKLLSQFRTVQLPAPVRRTRRSSAWLLPVAMAALIFLFAAALFLPALSKAKSRSMRLSLLSPAGTDSPVESEVARVQELRRRGVVATDMTVNGPRVSFANSGAGAPATHAVQPGGTPQVTVRGFYDAKAGEAPPPPAAAGSLELYQQSSSFGLARGRVESDKPAAQQQVKIVLPSAGDTFQTLTVDGASAGQVQAQIEPGPGLKLNESLSAESTAAPSVGAGEQVPLQLNLPAPAFKGTPKDFKTAAEPAAVQPLPGLASQAGAARFGGIGGGGSGIAGSRAVAPAQERVTERYDQFGAAAVQTPASGSLGYPAQSAASTLSAGTYFWEDSDVSKVQNGRTEAESLGRTWHLTAPQPATPSVGDAPTLGKMFAGRANQDNREANADFSKQVEAGLALNADRLAVTRADETPRARGEQPPARRPDVTADLAARRLADFDSLAQGVRQEEARQAMKFTNRASNVAAADTEGRQRFMRRYGLAAGPTPSSAPAKAEGVELQEEAKKVKEVLRAKLEENISNVATPASARVAPVPPPEVQTAENPFSTFSLNVSDVSYRLAAASLEKGALPDPAGIRSEEFINAFDYRDPEPAPGAPIALAWERARYPFAHNRDVLRFSVKTAAAGRQAGKAMNLVLVLDNSGSMERADRVQIIREALRVLATQLQPQDKLSVVTFARTATLRVDGLGGDKAAAVLDEIGQLTPEGGTNLEEAMNVAYETARKHYVQSGINRVVLLTDGAANLGNVDPETLKQRVEAQRKQGVALDCFGIGWEGYDDDMLEVLSRNGDGRYAFINTPEAAAADFAQKLAGALEVAASDVKVQIEFNPQRVNVYRQVGYAKHQLTKEQFRDNTVDAAEIASKEAGNAVYIIQTNPEGNGPVGYVRVRYKVPGTEFVHEHEWAIPYDGASVNLPEAPPAMRLAASAAAFSEWLAGSPWAAEATPDRILQLLQGVPQTYGPDQRPAQFVSTVQQAQRVAPR